MGAALATAITLTVVSASAPEPESASALAVFDREPLGIDDPSNLTFPLEEVFRDAEGTLLTDLNDVTLRWVGVADGNEVYAARWNHGEGPRICLIVDSTEHGAGVACTLEADFIGEGLRMGAFGLELKWGPTDTDVWVTTFR